MPVDLRKILIYFEEKFNQIYSKLENLNNSFSTCEIITKNITKEETIILKPNTQNIIIKDIIIASTLDDNPMCEIKVNFGLSYIIFVITKEQPTLHINLTNGILLKYNLPATARIENGCSSASITLIYNTI
ncbi:hypothetical protein PL321_02615 [Caloramator sp. mosi_1]|uniref:hypothetical protein n=1 Tax=Caloramator sp. mosi_1 TaxID=3023090 RepID=UPI002362F104|nr:hypothetical protein [Caloramator sp. mosi_1]WDC84617.1 hypothetical protein PL321_02615 [Caloramator sp. mosi_1]